MGKLGPYSWCLQLLRMLPTDPVSPWFLWWQVLDGVTRGPSAMAGFVSDPESTPVPLLGSDKSAFTRVASTVSLQPTG